MNTFHSEANTFSRNLTAYFDEKLSEFGMATSYVELILLLKRGGGQTQKQLAENLSLAPSTITRFIEKLAKQNLVEKERTGREVAVKLTDKGVERSDKMSVVYDETVNELKERFGEKFMDTVGKLLEFGNRVLTEKSSEQAD